MVIVRASLSKSMICSSALILLALTTSRNNSILRSHGVVFIALYAGYLFYVTTR